MTRRIFKYEIKGPGAQIISMPRGAEIVAVQMQGIYPFMWAVVDDEAPAEDRRFYVAATGEAIPDDSRYLDTFYMRTAVDTPLVWHLLEPTSPGAGEAPQ